MNEFLDGMAFAGFLAVAVWFARAWLRSHDRLLLAFATAFAIFALNRLVLAGTERGDEGQTVIYLLRAVAFMLIIAAILDRNRNRDVDRDAPRSSSGVIIPEGEDPR